MERNKPTEYDAVLRAQQAIAGKWSFLVLYYLSKRPYRFNELQRVLPSMTQATLSKLLKTLEARGLISRKKYPQIPPKVEYSVGPVGELFLPLLKDLTKAGQKAIKLFPVLEETEE
ncbi:MAG: helix-turn-helix domain-containing protein [Clostridia bacterium]|nr:helix-turn-helix domain-containing protein [Clostridia bacterium]